jgi:hypothetical protein
LNNRSPGNIRRMHVQAGDVEGVRRRKIDKVVECSILLLARSVSRGGGATTRTIGANLLAPLASRLRGHRGSLSFHPTRAASSLREGTTRRRRGNRWFLLNLVRVATELYHRWVAATHHVWRGFGKFDRLKWVSEEAQKAKMLRLEPLWVREERGAINRQLNWSPRNRFNRPPHTGSTGFMQCGLVTRFGQGNKAKKIWRICKKWHLTRLKSVQYLTQSEKVRKSDWCDIN